MATESARAELPAAPVATTVPATTEAANNAATADLDTFADEKPGAPSSSISPEPAASSDADLRKKSQFSLRTHLTTSVDPFYTWIPLIISSFVSGLNDASAFAAWGTFTDMQTGNTIFLALGASHQPVSPPFAWLKALIAIVAFLLACFTLPRIQRLITPSGTSRAGLFVSWFVQGASLIIAGGLVQGRIAPQPWGVITPADMDPRAAYLVELAPIALMAFQAGGQITSARMLGFNEIPTIVLTSAYCDLTSDPDVFKLRNPKRDRRVMSAVALLVGGIAGGWLSRSYTARMQSVLWLGASLKLAISVSFLFWKAKSEKAKN